MNQKIENLGQKCLRILPSNAKTASFLGGNPVVRSEFEWPRKNNKPLGFVAQLDLKELNSNKEIEWLPIQGRLLFFYDLDKWPWGFDPNDKGGWAIIYENGSAEPHPIPLPEDLNKDHILPSIKYVVSESFTSYPDEQRVSFEELGITEDEDEDYFEFIDEKYGDEPRHQIGGFPSPIQNDNMEEECELVSRGVNCGGAEGYNSKEAERIRKESNDWQLVLQYDSDDDIGAMWGDLGMLYFWVKESDARKNDFSKSWMVLQCS